ncbi:hypothetical protein [Chitinimonas koreensis]|uniref:hypothetical protein n=1 Tax=Chitinimonas koreensis TaxID=356302 RepID=UPI0004072C2E|nr:hypothetical protein [Chitinimonas koreensis]QNM98182.1 hypothetical protein H9L41_08040 [Chitinimonas koreensis]
MLTRSVGLAIVINLDYLNLPYDTCRMMWVMIENAMVRAGFILDGREFVAMNDPAASDRARQVLKALEPTFVSLGYSMFDAVREFYCYDLASRVDLNMVGAAAEVELVDSSEVEVVELPAGAGLDTFGFKSFPLR